MDTSKLVPNDPRVREETAVVRGKTYSYLIGEARDGIAAETVFLLHGFPDLNFGWRWQMPFLMGLGFRVVAPSMLGYGGTSRPEELAQWSLRNVADDVKALAGHIVGGNKQIVLGGHDWGGAAAWRVVLWHPGLVKAVFSVCTPFQPPRARWRSLEDHVAAGRLLSLRYQAQLAGPEVEAAVRTEDQVARVLDAVFGGSGPAGEPVFTTDRGVDLALLPRVRPTPLLSTRERRHYAARYMLQPDPPLRGPLNWYRTRRLNHDDELALIAAGPARLRIHVPALFIAAARDPALPPAMAAGMERHFAHLTRREVNAGHWALVEAADEVNAHIAEWLADVLPPAAVRPLL